MDGSEVWNIPIYRVSQKTPFEEKKEKKTSAENYVYFIFFNFFFFFFFADSAFAKES